MSKLILRLMMAIMLFIQLSISQSQFDFKCGFNGTYSPLPTPLGMGFTKPMKTLPIENTNRFFRVLMIYVEFANDNTGNTSYWTPRQLPVYANQLFATQKQLGLNSYEQYKTVTILTRFRVMNLI